MSISELCIVGKPVILIPSPNVSEDHQAKNAQALSDINAAILLPDSKAISDLFSILKSTLENKQLMNKMTFNIKTLAKPKATEAIVDEIENLV